MTIHKTGYGLIFLTLGLLVALNYGIWQIAGNYHIITCSFSSLSLIFFILVVSFFRKPKREIHHNDNLVYAPADGKVVVIEEVEETEFLKEKRIQVSIFMSPLNVHINWFPVAGTVKRYIYHPGKHMCAWLPKASTENERTTIVVKRKDGVEFLVRQIAGALARRIVCFTKEGYKANQNSELGFIKFGSRVDVFLPLDAEIKVNLEQKVTGTQTVIAEVKSR